MQFTIKHYQTHAIIDQFAVNPDGSPATGNPPPPPPPNSTFALSASPASVSGAGATTIALAAKTGFAGKATLSVAGVPSGATASLGTAQLGSGASTTLTLAPGTATAGTYALVVSGVDGSETETTSLAWSVGAASTCAHDTCATGAKLDASCDACVGQICAKDSYCCDTAWSSVCIDEVASICGESTCSGSTSTCTHDQCTAGAKLASGCDACVTEVCGKDAYCCKTSWDATCVAEVGTICGGTCP